MDIDVYALSDDDLAAELRARGVEVGPVVESTRRVYQRKLEKILSGNDESSMAAPDDMDYGDEEDDDDSEIQFNRPEVISPADRGDMRQRPPRQKETFEEPPPREPPAPPQPSRPRTANPRSQAERERVIRQNQEQRETPSEKEGKKGGMSVWVQLIIIAIVAVIIFLVISNMEPGRSDPMKGIEGV